MTFGSLFAGIGGFDLGFERAGMECKWQVEIDSECQQVLGRHFPAVGRYGDIREVSGLDPTDVVCGGFPCQDLSVAGKRAGLAGERSGLFWQAHRIVAETQPRFVVIENVPGLLSSNEGRDMEAVVRSLVELGYRVCWRVLDAQYFRVPQKRRRLFIVGSLGDGSAAEVLFEPESVRGDSPPSRQARSHLATDVAASLRSGGAGHRGWTGDAEHGLVAATLTSGSHPGSNAPGRRREDDVNLVAQSLKTENNPSKGLDHCSVVVAFTQNQAGDVLATPIAPCMGTNQNASGRNTPKCYAVRTAQTSANGHGVSDVAHCLDGANGQAVAFGWNKSASQTMRVGETTDALQASPTSNPAVFDEAFGVRRFTPLECERLQGFLDYWTDGFSDSARYRMIGNAVPPPMAEWLGKRIQAVKETS